MGTTLTGKRVQNTYDSLLKLSNNDNLTGTAQIVTDGLGNDSPIYLSTTRVGIGVSPTYEFQTNSNAKIGGNLIVGGNLTVNGTTTIVDSTVVAIGDNMIEMAKDNVANTMDIGWYGTIVESGTKFIGMKYDAGSGVTTPEFHIGLGTVEPGSTAEWTVKGKLVIGQIDSTGGTFSGQITIPETPTADGHAASKKYVDDQIVGADKARRVTITVKNTETVALSAGTVVHAEPTASPPSGNIVQVKKADYDTASLMPAIGILNEDLDAAGGTNDEGEAIMFGFINGIDTSSFSAGDELYVGNDGSLTNSKPLLTTQLIQKIAVVMKVDASNGSIEVFGAGRSNDVPNEVDRDLSIAGTLKVDDEIQVEADSGYGRLEVGGPDGGYIDLKTPFSDDYDLRIITNSSGSEFTGSGDFNINAGNTLTLTLDGTTQDATFAADIFSDGLYVNSTSAVSGTQVAIVKQDASTNLQRWGTSADGSSQDSYRFRIDQDMKFIGNSGSADTITINSSTGNIDTSGQITAYQSTIYRGSDGYALRLDSANSSTDNDLRFAKGGTDYGAIQSGGGDGNLEFYVNSDGSGSGWIQSFYIEKANGNVNFNYAINSIGNSGGMYFYNTGLGHGVIETMSGKDLNILSGSGDVYVKDNLNLTTGSASTMLKFYNDVATRKIQLWSTADNDYQFYGFGVEGSTLVYSLYDVGDAHVFFAGASSTTRDELARIKGGGGVQFSQYGSGSFTGTSAYNLAVDSSGNIIETDGDVIDGSGTANYVAKWSDENTLGNSSIYDTGSYTSIGGTDTSGRLTVHSTGDVEYLTLNTTATTNKRIRLQFTQNDNDGIEIGTDYAVNNSSNMYIYDRVAGGSAWLFMSQTNNWFQGNLGVGMTSNPTSGYKLHIAGRSLIESAAGYLFDVQTTDTNQPRLQVYVDDTSGVSLISGYNTTPKSMLFYTGGQNRLTIDSSGNITASVDSDLTYEFGKSHIGYVGHADHAGFSHIDVNAVGSYALLQSNDGETYLNAASGQNIRFRNNNSDLAIIDSSGNIIVNGTTALATATNRGNITIDGTDSILSFGLSGSLGGYIYMETGQMLINSGTRHINFEVNGNTTVEFQDNANKLSAGTTNHNWFPYVDGSNYYSADTHIFRNASHSNEFIHMYQNSIYPFRWRRTSSDVQGKLYTDSGGAGIAATDLNQAGMYMVANSFIDWRVNGGEKMLLNSLGHLGIGQTNPSATLHITASTPSLTLETSANSNDPVITLKSNGAITGEGAQIYYDNSVGTLHLTTTYVDSTADIVFHTATGADQATGNVRMRVKGNGDIVFKETLSTKDNRINSGYSTAANDSDIWINYEGYQNDLSYYRDFRVGNGRGSQIAIFDGSTSRVGIMVSSKYPDAKFEVYHDGGNGGGNYNDYGILTEASGSYQATIGAHNTGDGYANLNLSSDVSGQKLWHLSKRPSANGHRLEYFYYDAGFTSRFAFFTNGDFHADGDIVAYSTTISDASLKDNVVTIDNALDKVKQLRGVSYKWNSGPRNQQKDLGVIAQEVEKVFPEIVYEKQALYHGSKQVKSVDYEKLTAVLIESVKELSAKVEALENKKCNCNCK